MKGSNEVMTIRLGQEKKRWKKSSIAGFKAKPMKNRNGTVDMTKWKCLIPGPKGSIWE